MATERMIDRLEAEGGYNEDFMNEFRIFRKELRGFFSASTFTDILEAIKPSLDEGAVQVPLQHEILQLLPSYKISTSLQCPSASLGLVSGVQEALVVCSTSARNAH